MRTAEAIVAAEFACGYVFPSAERLAAIAAARCGKPLSERWVADRFAPQIVERALDSGILRRVKGGFAAAGEA